MKPTLTLAESIRKTNHDKLERAKNTVLERTAERRFLANRIARILRKLGFKDAVAEQSDTGRRDVTANFMGRSFIIGVFSPDNHIALLPPRYFANGNLGWIPINHNLKNLCFVLKLFLPRP